MNLSIKLIAGGLLIVSLMMVGCGRSENYDWGNVRSAKKSLGLDAKSESAQERRKSLTANRKVIYSANISISVEEFDSVEMKVRNLVQQYAGFITDASLDTRRRQRRSGNWTARIPADNFSSFLTASGSIGVVTSRSQSAEDVTEEYVDIESRITNKKKLESRILKLLERSDDKIEHIIEVEKELGRIREEIERIEGRRRFLADRVELTTVHLFVTEEATYSPSKATSFAGRVSQAWNRSLINTRRGIENSLVWLAGHLLAALSWGVILVIAVLYLRRKINSAG